MKTVSILDKTALHLPHLFSKGDRQNLNLEKIIVTDEFLATELNNKYKFAWLVEPQAIFPYSYHYIKYNYQKFDKVLTHDISILSSVPNSIFMPFGTSFIEEKDFKIYEKNRLVSMVSSNKNFTYGHSFRLKVLNHVANKLDIFGKGINPVDYKLDCLKDYMFSIAVENSKHDFWFTEKLLDCFLTGTIPIYWGCPSINKFFDVNGILCFDNIQELDELLQEINQELYQKKYDSIKTNFEIAKKFTEPYDKVYEFSNSYN